MIQLKVGDRFYDHYPARDAKGVQFKVDRILGVPTTTPDDQKLLDEDKARQVGDIIYSTVSGTGRGIISQSYANQYCELVTRRRDPLSF